MYVYIHMPRHTHVCVRERDRISCISGSGWLQWVMYFKLATCLHLLSVWITGVSTLTRIVWPWSTQY